MRAWYWSQPAVAVVLLGFTAYTLYLYVLSRYELSAGSALPSFQFLINGVFIFPGMLLSLGVSQVMLSRRLPRAVTLPERILLGIEYLLLIVIVATSFAPNALDVGLALWPILILVAITISIVIGVTTTLLKQTPNPVEPV
jgi:hypothetical protein